MESFAKQTVLPLEFVVTDNGSTDNTLAMIASFAAKAPFPVRAEKNETNIGYRASFMKAAALCKGDLIAFSDHDDVWLPERPSMTMMFCCRTTTRPWSMRNLGRSA